MYDNVCRNLALLFSADFARWLIGEPIELTELKPTELLLAPIRADSVIFLQSEDLILHIEFQTDVKDDIPFRMADYRLRLYRLFPVKRVYQVVIYLRKTSSPLAQINKFQLPEIEAKFNVIRLWEIPTNTFFQTTGLLPFAVLSQTDNLVETLHQVASKIEKINDDEEKSNLTASAGIIAGLVLKRDIIQTLLRQEIMKESVIYQDILAKGLTEGEILGVKKGIKQGEANLVLKQLNRRIGLISPEFEQKIRDKSIEELESLGEALLDFQTQDDLINWFNSHHE